MIPPIAAKINKELVHLGDIRMDDYYWLNNPEDPAVMDYLVAENEYTTFMLSDVSEFKSNMYNEIISRIKQTDISLPYRIRGYYYYIRYEQQKEYPIHCRKKDGLDQPEEILLDVNELAQNTSFCQVTGLTISPDNRLLAYGIDTEGRRLYTIKFKDLTTGITFRDSISNSNGHVAWANDNQTIFYAIKNPNTYREEKIVKHRLSADIAEDTIVFFEKDEAFNISVFKTKSEQFIFISSNSTISDEIQFLDADHPDLPFTTLQTREPFLEYSVDHFGENFIILTNYQAKNFRLMETSISRPSRENWKEIVPHRPDVLLESFDIFNLYLVISERIHATRQLRVVKWKDMEDHSISFDEEVYTTDIDFNPDFDSENLRFRYSSFTTPNSIFEFNMRDHSRVLLKRQEVVGDFDPFNYESQRLFAVAADGVNVPISLVYRKGMQLNGNNPLLLYGYGSYGISIDPTFSHVNLSLLDRGFIYAIAHIRGGEELGRTWYENGKLNHKKNTFTDFIACAEYLIKENYTNSGKIFAIGRSAGGLLMGAIVNLRPDLFHGVIASVPFVDVLTTMLDESIPLTTIEYDEWGNPDQQEFYDYIKSYSPYDNITSKAYPHLLVMTGLYDSQVSYWEPAKWVAKLRSHKTDRNLLLLHTNMDAGHSGASGRFEKFRETAMEFVFLCKLADIFK